MEDSYVYLYTHTHTHTHTHIIQIYSHTHIIHIYSNTHTHTHTHTSCQAQGQGRINRQVLSFFYLFLHGTTKFSRVSAFVCSLCSVTINFIALLFTLQRYYSLYSVTTEGTTSEKCILHVAYLIQLHRGDKRPALREVGRRARAVVSEQPVDALAVSEQPVDCQSATCCQ